jgi:hydrogenase 3 maturation protease
VARSPLPPLAEALAGARRVAVVGVGSDLRGDDAAGLRVAARLAAWAVRTGSTRLAAFVGGAAPENFTGEISRFKPDCLVLVDAAHLGRRPGELALIAPEQVGGLAFSTHMLPVPFFLRYLEATTGCRSVVIGIQVAQKDVLAPLTPAVAAGVRRLVAALQRAAVAAEAAADAAAGEPVPHPPRRSRSRPPARARRRGGGAR